MLFNAEKGLWSRNVLWLFYNEKIMTGKIILPKMTLFFFFLIELQSFNYYFTRCYRTDSWFYMPNKLTFRTRALSLHSIILLVFQHLLQKSLRLLRLSWNKWVKMRPSELFQIHESEFLRHVNTEGGDARSSGLQPPWSEKRNGLLSLMRWTWAILIDLDWSIALVSSNTLRDDGQLFEELLLFWYVCFLLNMRSIVHGTVL